MTEAGDVERTPDEAMLRARVTRLARRHSSGGVVIERAAVLAEGSTSRAILTWITDHGGRPEAVAAPSSTGLGLHSARMSSDSLARSAVPSRYILPRGALTD